jgi:hypothetical protein
MRRKALEGEGGAILSTYLAPEEGAVCCMVTASADKTQQEAQTPDQASQWWLVFRASAGGVIVASRPAEACLLRLGTGKQADWGRPLVGPVTGTTGKIRHCTVPVAPRYRAPVLAWAGKLSPHRVAARYDLSAPPFAASPREDRNRPFRQCSAGLWLCGISPCVSIVQGR